MDFFSKKDKTRKKYSIFASFIICCLGTSLSISSLATQYWFESGCKNNGTESPASFVHFGLFTGRNSLKLLGTVIHDTKLVCLNGKCMFSCGRTKSLRLDQLRLLENGTLDNQWMTDNCDRVGTTNLANPVASLKGADLSPPSWSLVHVRQQETDAQEGDRQSVEAKDVLFRSGFLSAAERELENAPYSVPHEDPEFMNYGLWVGTISCLVIGMVFAVTGALFAVINTATTPVEFITGVPGLYIWNSLAAFFNLLSVILWAVQFHKHLTKNVLLYDADSGWTTQGLEVFGYSYWLVVVSIIVHVANIVIIFLGTYERKVKEVVEGPQQKEGNIMLY